MAKHAVTCGRAESAVTRKIRTPLSQQRATAAVRGMAKLDVVQVDVPLVLTAVDTSAAVGISLWDALMIEERGGLTAGGS